MLLEPDEAELFFKLYWTLMLYVNQRLGIAADVNSPQEYASLPPETRIKVRNAVVADLNLIEAFVEANPAGFRETELDIVRSWRHLVAGDFYVFRELKNYTVFLAVTNEPVAYGVLALSQPFESMIGPHLPVMTQTILLPFQEEIIYDGLLASYSISFGPGIRRVLNESYKKAKQRLGIVTSLPISPKPPPKTAKAPRAKPAPKAKSKAAAAEMLAIVTDLTDQFCRNHLNDEYAAMCRKLAETLARKRPSPLLGGWPGVWACGIIRTVGWVNFLHDKSQTPYMRLIDIDAEFGISESTGAAKLAAIRKMLRIHQLDPNWTLPSRMDRNPLAWLSQFGGLLEGR